MCLAVPGQIVECRDQDGLVDLEGNRLRISLALTPEARAGDWVLVHAGFAIAQLDEAEARETWEYLKQIQAHGEALAGETSALAGETSAQAGETSGLAGETPATPNPET